MDSFFIRRCRLPSIFLDTDDDEMDVWTQFLGPVPASPYYYGAIAVMSFTSAANAGGLIGR